MVKLLEDVCDVYSGYALKSFNESEDGLPVIKIGNITSDGYMNLLKCDYSTEKVSEKYYSQLGDIYVALSGATTGKIGIMTTGERHIINQRVGIVRKTDKNIPDSFIKYFLLGKTERILHEAAGAAQPNISPKQISKYQFPELSVEEMTNISIILDEITKLINSQKQELSLLDELIKARFVELFENAPTKTVEEVCDSFKIGPFGSALHKNEISKEGYAFVLGTDNAVKNKFAYDEIRYIDEAKYHELEKYKVNPEEIIMSMMGTVGRVSIIPEDIGNAIISSHLCILRVNKKCMIPEFFHCAFCEDDNIQFQIDGIHNGSIMKGFNLKIVKAFEIKCPEIDKQKEFLQFKKQLDKSKYVCQKKIKLYQELLDTKMNEYFN